MGSVSRCRWCAATATFCWQCMCVVCAREKEGRLNGRVPNILRARPVGWVSLRLCTAYIICYPNAGSH